MRLLPLLLAAALAPGSFSAEPDTDAAPRIAIAYEVLEVFPRSRRVLVTCHAARAPPPVTYSLWGGPGVRVAQKVVRTQAPASFSINVTLKSRPDLLGYACRAASGAGLAASATLQLDWELWAQPVGHVQADFTLLDSTATPRVAVSCRASTGSPPITYTLVGKDGRVHLQQRPGHGRPANFSLPLTQASGWLRCQAANDVSVQSSPLTLVPPGRLPRGPAMVLAGSLTSAAAAASGMLGWSVWTRL